MYRYTENMTLPQPVQSLEIHKKESSVVERKALGAVWNWNGSDV